MEIEIRPAPYDSAAALELIEAVQGEYELRYGGRDSTPVSPQEFAPPLGAFFVAFLDGRPVGCGGFRTVGDAVGEIKRMYVRPDARQRGVARALLSGLEKAAVAAGCREMILETGSKQPEALALYASSGYAPVPAFGTYQCAPGARHLGKSLTTGMVAAPVSSRASA
ncbi:MAG: GNAT family N-acetyltransferase [Mycobacteriales bacterium]